MMKLTKNEEELLEQIYSNMCNRGIIEWESNPDLEGLHKSELYIFAYHLKKLFYEEISDLLLNKSMNFDDLEELKPEDRKNNNELVSELPTQAKS